MKTAILYNKYSLFEIEDVSPDQLMHELIQVDSIFSFLRSDSFTEVELDKLSKEVTHIVNVSVVDNHKAISYYDRVSPNSSDFKIHRMIQTTLPMLHTDFIDNVISNLESEETQKLYDYDLTSLKNRNDSNFPLSFDDYRQLVNFVEAYQRYSTITVGENKLYISPKDFKGITDAMILSSSPVWSVIELVTKQFDTTSYK